MRKELGDSIQGNNVIENEIGNMDVRCRVCGSEASEAIFEAQIFDRPVSYYDCNLCGYVQTQEPTWLDQAYSSAIGKQDTGIMLRNQNNVNVVLATLIVLRARNGIVVDFAGGYGILVRMLRDIGIEALWSDRYGENLLAKGFEHADEKAQLVTAFEAFEHFVNPVEELEKLVGISRNILFSTLLIPNPAPKSSDWWYYSLSGGQHVGFYRERTLVFLADKFHLNLISDGNAYHLFSKEKISKRRWLIVMRASRRLASLYSFGLASKTWEDFNRASQIES
jgi:hypothetical protein